jgi:hypothetical protein
MRFMTERGRAEYASIVTRAIPASSDAPPMDGLTVLAGGLDPESRPASIRRFPATPRRVLTTTARDPGREPYEERPAPCHFARG